jgi:hypothetical protein
MSIFSRIKEAIFGDEGPVTPRAPANSARAPAAKPAPPAAAMPPGGIPASPAAARWEREVDVEAVLEARAGKSPQKLNWRTSIVDLMKLLDLDSSLENRKELARELGYAGPSGDSAAMNVWLHKRVMQELQKNGGKVPESLVA